MPSRFKKIRMQKPKLCLKFDKEKREQYITGFKKRKDKRKKLGKKIKAAQEKELRNAMKAERDKIFFKGLGKVPMRQKGLDLENYLNEGSNTVDLDTFDQQSCVKSTEVTTIGESTVEITHLEPNQNLNHMFENAESDTDGDVDVKDLRETLSSRSSRETILMKLESTALERVTERKKQDRINKKEMYKMKAKRVKMKNAMKKSKKGRKRNNEPILPHI